MRISDWSSDVCSSDLDERDRKWFSFSDAASAVDEPDLQALIRSFGDSGFRAVAQPRDVVQNMGDKTGVSRMFAWFQRLLPRQGNFFDLFESHAATLVAGANALSRMLQGGEGMADHAQAIIERGPAPDATTR